MLNSSLGSPQSWQPVQLESVELSPTGKQIKGTVNVLNLAFQKNVVARFTFDSWKTVSEVTAEYRQSLHLGHSIIGDKFVFMIDRESVSSGSEKVTHVCVRYNVLDQEFWDNNGGSNYRVAVVI